MAPTISRDGSHPVASSMSKGCEMSFPMEGVGSSSWARGCWEESTKPITRFWVAGTPLGHRIVPDSVGSWFCLEPLLATAIQAAVIVFHQRFVMQSKELFLVPTSFKALSCLLHLCFFNNIAHLPLRSSKQLELGK